MENMVEANMNKLSKVISAEKLNKVPVKETMEYEFKKFRRNLFWRKPFFNMKLKSRQRKGFHFGTIDVLRRYRSYYYKYFTLQGYETSLMQSEKLAYQKMYLSWVQKEE